jgi:hypothetical protein
MRKWILIFTYVTFWILIIPDSLPYFVIYDKSRVVLLIFGLLLMFVPPYILFKALTEFNVDIKKKWGVTFGSLFLLIPYGILIGQLDDKRLSDKSEQTEGIVYEKWTTKRKPLLRAKYKVDNKAYETFSKTDFNDLLEVGDTVTIIYWTEYPELSKIKELEK